MAGPARGARRRASAPRWPRGPARRARPTAPRPPYPPRLPPWTAPSRAAGRPPAARRRLVTTHDARLLRAAATGSPSSAPPSPPCPHAAQPRRAGRRADRTIRRTHPRALRRAALNAGVEAAVARQSGARIARPVLDTLGPPGSPGATYLGAIPANTRCSPTAGGARGAARWPSRSAAPTAAGARRAPPAVRARGLLGAWIVLRGSRSTRTRSARRRIRGWWSRRRGGSRRSSRRSRPRWGFAGGLARLTRRRPRRRRGDRPRARGSRSRWGRPRVRRLESGAGVDSLLFGTLIGPGRGTCC